MMNKLKLLTQGTTALGLFYLSWSMFLITPATAAYSFFSFVNSSTQNAGEDSMTTTLIIFFITLILIVVAVLIGFFFRWLAKGFLIRGRFRIISSAILSALMAWMLLASSNTGAPLAITVGIRGFVIVHLVSAALYLWIAFTPKVDNEA